jgi:hypothetical protein
MFMDDILIYSSSFQENEQHLRNMLQTLRKHRLYAKFNKCKFWLKEVVFLGYVIFTKGVLVDLRKVEVVLN